jgi:uncharacterized SAM-binding protein YcdF (DUF218 family)
LTPLLFTIFSVRGIVMAMLACAAWLVIRPRSGAARRTTVCVACAYAFASIYLVPAMVARLLTGGYHEFTAADVPTGSVAIVVLAAGADTVDGWDGPIGIVTEVTASRTIEAARVFRLLPRAVVVASGGVPPGVDEQIPEAVVMRTFLVQLGVPDSSIVTESTSRDTHDQAVLVAPILRARGVQRVVLVTSDIHMPRSLGAFRAAGVTAVPAIALDPGVGASFSAKLIPSGPGLDLTARVVHEIVGLPYYRVRGWWR